MRFPWSDISGSLYAVCLDVPYYERPLLNFCWGSTLPASKARSVSNQWKLLISCFFFLSFPKLDSFYLMDQQRHLISVVLKTTLPLLIFPHRTSPNLPNVLFILLYTYSLCLEYPSLLHAATLFTFLSLMGPSSKAVSSWRLSDWNLEISMFPKSTLNVPWPYHGAIRVWNVFQLAPYILEFQLD